MESQPVLAEQTGERVSRPLFWWDIAAAALILLMAAVGAVDAWPPGGRLAAALAMLAAFSICYVWLGRPVLRRAHEQQSTDRAGYAFLALAIVLVGIGTAVLPSYATLQALAYPMIWWVLDHYREAVVASGALAIVVGAGTTIAYAQQGLDSPAVPAVAVAVLSFAFAVVMGTWISRIFAQGERHRALAEQLRASQEEVAALSTAAGAAAERERLSRELHDTLTQTLTGLVMLGEQADQALAAGQTERARERIARVQAASRAAVEEARALVATTHPLGDGGLEQAIGRVVANLGEDTGTRVSCALEAVQLDREGQVVLLRAAQEGLSNVRRHARAEHVAVSLRSAGGTALLTVEDDGVGPPSGSGIDQEAASPSNAALASSGFGLSGLRDRVRLVGGEVRFGPRVGGGARLEVRVPLGAPASAGADPVAKGARA